MLKLDKIYNMDCLEGIKQIPDKIIDLVLTDIPWDIKKKDYDIGNGLKTLKLIRENLLRITKNNSHLLFDISFEKIFDLHNIIKNIFNYRQPIILYCNNQIGHRSYAGWNHFRMIMWYCRNNKAIPKRYRDVIEFPMVSLKKENWKYPNPKSIFAYSKLIEMFSKENDIILDCFIGSGTTALACKQLNRHFIGFEINHEYFKIANNRLLELNKNV